ncbi:MAG: type I pullulanase, partial [Deltaproteobacteria bacterium]|nr:type I pullulanase [Deltaproteobacteria bacterium]
GWYLWIWPEGQPGALYEFTGEDPYGAFCRIDCSKLSQHNRIGILIKKSRDRWDQGEEEIRFIDIRKSIPSEVWLLENDPITHYKTPEIKIRFVAAFIDEPNKIVVNLPSPITTDKNGNSEDISFSLYEDKAEGKVVPIQAVKNGNAPGFKSTYHPREEGYDVLENGVVHFIFDPAQKSPAERIEGSRSVFVLGTHNNWKEGEGDAQWRMKWNDKESYYELYTGGLNLDGSVQFRFKENGEEAAKNWFPAEFDPPFSLLGLQTRTLVIELEKDLDIRYEYYLNGEIGQKVIPRKVLTGPRFLYTGDDLGARYSPQGTMFKVFAPMASKLSVTLYPDLYSHNSTEISMIHEAHGVWNAHVPGDIKGQYYTFRLTSYKKQSEVMDPYCHCVCSCKRGMVSVSKNQPSSQWGVFYSQVATCFRYSFPQALDVQVILYKAFIDKEGVVVPLTKNEQGIYEGSLEGDWKETFYMIQITTKEGEAKEIVDPWAEIIAVGPSRGKIVDFAQLNNQIQWQDDLRPPFQHVSSGSEPNKPEDAIIYELHVRDFTIAPNSGVIHKGLYKGLTEAGTKGPGDVKTGIDHLLELGVTHVQIMPIQNFTSWTGSEQFHRIPHYNWGYMPVLFNAPEAMYAGNSTDESIILEFKQMIKTLHKAGLRVILDVVYNHYDVQAPFDTIAPYYYFRMNEFGQITNGSGTGNEFNSTYPMARKFILDSVKFWVEEYHIDGFRFDLMGLIDIETMTQVAKEIHSIDPTILIYGEPWSAGPSPLKEINSKGKQKGRGYGVFNDHFRNAVKGLSDTQDPAFVQGVSSEDTAGSICRGLEGSIEDFTQDPGETINYVTCHDNLVLRDKLEISSPLNEDALKRMVKLSGLLVLVAQGIPFLHSGMEMYRTKQQCNNSYNQPDSLNQIDWQWKKDYMDIFDYLKGVIALRKKHPAFRLSSADEIRHRVKANFLKADQIVYAID